MGEKGGERQLESSGMQLQLHLGQNAESFNLKNYRIHFSKHLYAFKKAANRAS